jgi:stress response protein YsnF
MAYETIVAVFDTAAHAEAAVKALKAGGFADADISIFNEDRLARGRKAIAEGARETGLWSRLFGGDDDMYQHEAAVYHQVVDKGGVVVSARVLDTEVAHAVAILDLHRPVDVHDRAVTSGIAAPAHVEAVEKKLDAVPLAAAQQVALHAKVAEKNDQILRLAEEQLQVGKQMVESGRTRVRRFVTERPVSADVTLHEEHAEVLRKAVTDPKYVGVMQTGRSRSSKPPSMRWSTRRRESSRKSLSRKSARTTWRRCTTRFAVRKWRSGAWGPTARSSPAPPNGPGRRPRNRNKSRRGPRVPVARCMNTCRDVEANNETPKTGRQRGGANGCA